MTADSSKRVIEDLVMRIVFLREISPRCGIMPNTSCSCW